MDAHFWLGFGISFLSAGLGHILGRRAERRSLLSGADGPGRTRHKMGAGFYYIVPESEYIRLRALEMQSKRSEDD